MDSSKQIQDELEQRKAGKSTGNEMGYNQNTGELELVRPTDRPNPDVQVMSQIARDGFSDDSIGGF